MTLMTTKLRLPLARLSKASAKWAVLLGAVALLLIIIFWEPRDTFDYEDHEEAEVQAAQVGGQPAGKDRYPYVCKVINTEGGFGTGFLIQPDVVLTAGHVVFDKTTGKLKNTRFVIRIGDVRWKKAWTVNVKEVIRSNYNSTGDGHGRDYALLRLEHPIKAIKPVKVAGYTGNVGWDIGSEVWALGFGNTSSHGQKFPDELQENVFRVTAISDTVITFKGDFEVKDKDFGKTRSACHGDSGGPLIVRGNGPDEDVVIGIVDAVTGDCARGKSNFATRVRAIFDTPNSKDAIDRLKQNKCTPAPRTNGACRSGYWDAGVYDKHAPKGYKGQQCTKNYDCALALNTVHRASGASVWPVFYQQ